MGLRFFRNISIIFAISVVILIAAEAILRIVYPDKITCTAQNISKQMAFQYDPDYLVALRPNVSGYFERSKANGGETIKWSTNDDGFRGPALLNRPKMRIITYGDSNILAEFSEYENTFTYKLGQYLMSGGLHDVESINAGVVGFGTDQSLIKFEKEADIYKPDIVIMHIFADNDFGDVIRNRLVEIDSRGNLVRTTYKRPVDECLEADIISRLRKFTASLLIYRAVIKTRLLITGEQKNNLVTAREKILSPKTLHILHNVSEEKIEYSDRGELQNLVVEELQKRADEEYAIYKESKPQKFSHCDDEYDIDVTIDPDSESSRTKIKLMELILKEARDTAASKGIKLLVVIQPSVIDMTLGNDPLLDYQYLETYPKYKRTNLTNTVKNICESLNIDYINLFDVFIGYDTSKLYFKIDDNHWNDRGQEIAAKATASYIINHMVNE